MFLFSQRCLSCNLSIFVKLFDLTATVHQQSFLVPLRLSNLMFFSGEGSFVSIRLKVITATPILVYLNFASFVELLTSFHRFFTKQHIENLDLAYLYIHRLDYISCSNLHHSVYEDPQYEIIMNFRGSEMSWKRNGFIHPSCEKHSKL